MSIIQRIPRDGGGVVVISLVFHSKVQRWNLDKIDGFFYAVEVTLEIDC